MKGLFVTLILALYSLAAVSQDKDLTDSTEYRFGLPVTSDDTTGNIRADKDPRNLWKRVKPADLPSQLKKTLSSDSLYNGWENSDLFFDQRIGQFIVRIRDKRSVRTYGFSQNGRPTSFSEENID